MIDQAQFYKDYVREYDKGLWNRLVRSWYYLMEGLNLVNQFKYVVLGIFGLYVALKFTNYIYLVLLFVTTLPLLVIAGWVYVNKMARNLSLTSMLKSSYFGRYNIDLAEETVSLLTEIRDTIKR